ncbi:sporulation protein [Anaerobacillus alkalidiazotrophicus]|uniref:Sporulation protein n=1 Tax=Anaerobacillus alkalidiazotrophicus TaxID=472963 RepID=A0A1S2M1W7_9BACI|nr:stage VI sporulation protein F [Anaerobacillus alkalidiazotrophicus]OIJ18731.1 sporulation protein [Anaerobacillus alkalidiazotrophicus]
MGNQFFGNIEKKTGVNMAELLKLAASIQNANLKDEATVRNLIKQVGKIANKPVKKEVEDKLVNTIINNSEQVNMNTIAKMLDKNNK